MILSVLICTLPEREAQYDRLYAGLLSQLTGLGMWPDGWVQIIHDPAPRGVSTGSKRNNLLSQAKGRYSVFIDDDDEVPDYYIEELLKAAESDADCFAINGTMTTNGANEKQWFIALGNPYIADWKTGKEIYLRYPNHLCPMKTEIARQVKFPDQTIGEDFIWATELRDRGLLKTQHIIEKPMYFYRYKENK